MADLPFMYGADQRSLFPEAALLNAIVEKAPSQIAKPTAILARPGLVSLADVGSGRVRGVGRAQGIFNGDAFVVIGTEVWQITAAGVATQITAGIDGDEDVRVVVGQNADLSGQVRIAAENVMYVYTDGDAGFAADSAWATATSEATATDIEYHRGDWLAIKPGTDQLYVLLPAGTWGALDFASAEYAADPLVFVRARGDQVFLGGQTTTEVWTKNSAADPAYVPYGGLNFDYGARGRNAAVSVAGAMVWVDNDGSVRLSSGGDAQVISSNGLVEQILQVDGADLVAWGFKLQQHFYYVLSIGALGTWVYDLTLQVWSRFQTAGVDYWEVARGVTMDSAVLGFAFGAQTVWRIDPDARDDDGTSFSWEFMARIENADGIAPCDNVELEMLTGYGPYEGFGSDPSIQMRYWDDRRGRWSSWRERPMGATGQTQRPRWNALGDFDRFRIFHWRVNAPIGRRVTAARINVA